jgi:membrane-associated protease RseP (regulator of RpoE activity)
VVTTAQAVNGRQGLEVVLPSGASVIGAVVFVDKISGTAVLAVPTELDASVVEVSPDQSHTTGAVMMSPEPLTVNVVADDTGVRLTYDGDGKPGEASIVLDQQGRLLGMCTMSSSGATLVSVDAMLKALDSAATVSVPAWLGIRPDKTTGGNVVVGSVVIDGPAQVGGIRAGDIIEAVDGIPVATLDELGQVIAAHAAGDSVVVRLARPGETAPVVIRITFSSHPDSM